MKILVIDNYDSFTFNLVQLVGKFTGDIIVKRNDEITIDGVREINPNKIIISPGPGRPENSNISLQIIRELGEEIPILGVCLGYQGIGQIFGCAITNAPVLMHGKISKITHDNNTIFKNIPQNFEAGRYHSLIIDRSSLKGDLEITCETKDHIIMGIRHKKYPIEGIQFHPESILTPEGVNIIKNWIEL